MATVPLNQLRKDPSALADLGQRVTVVRQGQNTASISIRLTPKADPEKTREKLKAWIARSKHIQPNPRNGGAAAVRRLRDGR